MAVPPGATALANLTVATTAALPAVVAAILVASCRYDVALGPTSSLVGALAFVALMTSSVGFALGHAVENPLVINLIGNLAIFLVLLFSPIAFPPEQLPGWLPAVHQVLLFQHMAATIRAGLTDDLVTGLAGSYAVLATWTVGSWITAGVIVGRRR